MAFEATAVTIKPLNDLMAIGCEMSQPFGISRRNYLAWFIRSNSVKFLNSTNIQISWMAVWSINLGDFPFWNRLLEGLVDGGFGWRILRMRLIWFCNPSVSLETDVPKEFITEQAIFTRPFSNVKSESNPNDCGSQRILSNNRRLS